MSWDSYVDSLIAQSGNNIEKATIIGLNGAIWTPAGSNPKILAISQDEASKIAANMSPKTSAAAQNFAGTGVTVGGTKYMFLRDLEGDGRQVTAKKVGVGSLSVFSTTQAVIISFCPEAKSHSFGDCNKASENIAKYLEGSGY